MGADPSQAAWVAEDPGLAVAHVALARQLQMLARMDEARERAEAESAQRRILEPSELGPMCILLASDAGAPMTGQVIGVDGGYRL